MLNFVKKVAYNSLKNISALCWRAELRSVHCASTALNRTQNWKVCALCSTHNLTSLAGALKPCNGINKLISSCTSRKQKHATCGPVQKTSASLILRISSSMANNYCSGPFPSWKSASLVWRTYLCLWGNFTRTDGMVYCERYVSPYSIGILKDISSVSDWWENATTPQVCTNCDGFVNISVYGP